jgi:hypothetical protein
MELPLFPLHLVLFPGAQAPLKVFEPRYRAMMERVLGDDRRLGVVAIRQGMEVRGPAETFEVGTISTVDQVRRDAKGGLDMVVTGAARFRIETRLPDDPFPIAQVGVIEERPGEAPGRLLPDARAAINRYVSVVAQIQGTDVVAPALPPDPIAASFALAAILRLDIPQAQQLLEAPDAAARLLLATELAYREARLLDAVGPSVGRPQGTHSLN